MLIYLFFSFILLVNNEKSYIFVVSIRCEHVDNREIVILIVELIILSRVCIIKEIMKVTLKDITMMQSGIYMKTDSQGEVRYLQVKDVDPESRLDYTQVATVINTGINDKHWLKKGDLLFAAKGGSNYCILYEGAERSTIASSSFIIIRPITSDVLPEFLCCFLNTPSILVMLKSAAVGTGIQVIPQSVIGEIQLDIPSIEVQKLVVEMDQLRRESECIRSEINELKQSLQDQLLMDSLK